MATLAIELNDAGIAAVRSGDRGIQAIPESPGYALFDAGRLLIGREAASSARLKPRWVYTRFWDELDATPLPRPFPGELTRADLAHAHLNDFWKSFGEGIEDVILAVPGWYEDAQLGLILGIARSCGMPVSGVIDSAVASASQAPPSARVLWMDLHLHRTAATSLRRERFLERNTTEILEGVGHVLLQDTWAQLVAATFVRETRFDPLHLAETEQRLYDGSSGWLSELGRRGRVAIEIEASGKKHAVELTKEQVIERFDGVYQRILELARSQVGAEDDSVVALTHRLAALPGLKEQLSQACSAKVVSLPPSAAASGALAHAANIRSTGKDSEQEELTFVTRLPVESPPPLRVTPPPESSRPRSRAPTHVLLDGVAHAITSEPLWLGRSIPENARGVILPGADAGISRAHCSLYRANGEVFVEDHSTYGSFLNGKPIERKAALAAGDRLRLGEPGIELQLIEVRS